MSERFVNLDDESQEQERAERLVKKYGTMLFRISYVILCNAHDAEDALQETFIKHLTKSPQFEGEEHEKAWLIKVITNISKNMCKFRLRHINAETIESMPAENGGEDSEILESMLRLPQKLKVTMYLYYVEGYKVNEIAEITGASSAAVRKRLQNGRDALKLEYEKDELL